MELKKIDIENTTQEELLSVLKENSRINKTVKDQIEKMSKVTESSEIEIKEMPDDVLVCPDPSINEEENDFFDELDYYISEFKSIKGKITESILDDVLPVRSNYNYKSIVLRLILEVSKDIKDINEIIEEETNSLSIEELNEYKEEIISLNETISMLRDRLKEKTNTTKAVVKENKLVFVPTSAGNMRVFDELKDIPEESYIAFLELFKSIKDGTFKNIRRFENNNKLASLMEVRGFQIRVAFQRISKDTYVIVSMFTKKNQNNNNYRKALEGKYAEYKMMSDTLKENINNEEFMNIQNDYEQELFRILGGEKDNTKGGYIND